MKQEDKKCPVCGKYEFEERYVFDVCSVCGWEDDGVQEQHIDMKGANPISLRIARSNYKKYGKIYN